MTAPALHLTSSRPLRGRAGETKVIEEQARAAADGRGGVVIVEGPRGIGKTHLVRHATAVASGYGLAVAAATARPSERLVPLAPLLGALGWLGLAPPAGAIDQRCRLLEELGSRLEDRLASRPLVIAIDDLDQADPATPVILEGLATELRSHPLLWILAADVSAAGSEFELMLRKLEHRLGAIRLALQPLAPAAVAELVGDVTGGVCRAEVVAALTGRSGNPFVLLETLDALGAAGDLDVTSEGVRLTGTATPPVEPHQIVSARIARLTPDTRQVLELAAVFGHSFRVDDVAELLREPLGRLLPYLREAIEAGVLVSTPHDLAFRHELTHRAVYDAVPPGVRAALHREVGLLLLDRGEPPLVVAAHLVHSTRRGDRKALSGLDRATREAMRWWPAIATEVAIKAVELTDPGDGDYFARAGRAVAALVGGRRIPEAIDVARSSLARLGGGHRGPLPAAQLRLTLASMLLMGGRPAEALAEAEAVVVQDDLPATVATSATLMRLLGLVVQEDPRLARQPAEAVLAGGDGVHADGALAGALAVYGFIAWREGQVADALEDLRAALHRGDGKSGGDLRSYARLGLALLLSAVGRFDEADAVIGECRREIERLGNTLWLPAVPILRARLHTSAGRLDEAVAEARVGLGMAEELGARLFVPMPLAVLASVALNRGGLDEAVRLVERFRAEIGTRAEGIFGSATYDFIAARVMDASGGRNHARLLVYSLCDGLPGHKRLLVEEPAAAGWLVRAARSFGDNRRAESAANCAGQLAADNPDLPSIAAAADHARGLLTGDAAVLEQAAEGHQNPWAQASAAEDTGVALLTQDRQAARVRFEWALTTFEQIGSNRDADRVRERLRRVGGRIRTAAGRTRPVAGWQSLTDTEHRVSALVAEALTNRQIADRMFLSHHTVDFHLRQIFRKLDISSRVQLTRLEIERRARDRDQHPQSVPRKPPA